MKDFRDLQIWKKAHGLTLKVYLVTKSFPAEEKFSLTNQLRRSAYSIGSNLAEGCGRGSDADLARFAQMAMGSACELEYQLLLSHDLEYLNSNLYRELDTQVNEIKRMLIGFLKTLRGNARPSAVHRLPGILSERPEI